MPGGGATTGGRVVGVDAVEADDGVEVDDAASLHLGGFAEREPHGRHPAATQPSLLVFVDDGDVGDAARPGEPVDGPVDGDGGASPQFAGHQVPHHVRVVVVAVETKRAAQPGIGVVVPGVAGEFDAMRADGQVAAGVAGFGAAVAVLAPRARVLTDDAGVDLTERRRGEGREHGRMPGHVFRDAFTAYQAGTQDLVGVTLVQLRA